MTHQPDRWDKAKAGNAIHSQDYYEIEGDRERGAYPDDCKGKWGCQHDTDGDGDCHLCFKDPNGCLEKQKMDAVHTTSFAEEMFLQKLDRFFREI